MTLLEVPKLKRNKRDESKKHQSNELMGDAIDSNSRSEQMNDQMRNELEVLRLSEKSPSIYMLEEVGSPRSPKSKQTKLPGSSPRREKTKQINDIEMDESDNSIESDFFMDSSALHSNSSGKCGEPAQIIVEIVKQDDSSETESSNSAVNNSNIKPDMVIDTSIKHFNADGKSEEPTQIIVEIINEEISDAQESSSALDADKNDEEKYESQASTEVSGETQPSHEMANAEPTTCVKFLKPVQTSHDTPSSDLSDTDTTDKVEKAYTESGVDETSRDERDEASEIENFDLSSCGEDSLEGMYYMLRKNEIIMDRTKQSPSKCDEDKIHFPDAATDELARAVHEVSGKKVKLCAIDSMNSSTDDVVLKKLSSDSDDIQLHVMPNSEIDSSSEPKSCPLKEEQCTANESTDDEFINPIVDSMRKNENVVNEMHAKALSVQPQCSDTQSDDQYHETDTFNEHLMDDMVRGNIERKILASSISEADSDYFELPPTGNRLTKDDFNVSTAFEHMIRSDSTTDDSESTYESAATKIQAGARGFLARRRMRKSSAGTSASNENPRSSFGNAAIDKSLDNLIEQQELMEETGYSGNIDENSMERRDLFHDRTIDSVDSEKILGITEVKVEQRAENSTNSTGNDSNENENENKIQIENSGDADENVPEINIQGTSEESATAQRRLMLQRGDAMQRNSTPESSEQQQQAQQQQQQQQQSDKGKTLTEPNRGKTENMTENRKDENENNDIPKIASPRANGKSNWSDRYD